ncbi:ferredoxin [Nocardioides sp. LMS-CY]|uniref:Ferredoxin n=1 Tax=Nocardioides soli TaxID=1036020 RepID=A0A7W4VTN8_9ACTN|nr:MULTISPECIES: ferredoxin [Nocardioides]MBB3041529.1 ferredoxin [Nocardioides soli]QWF23299.1 ferredoxin [Nocardioides sp. LMS-CY]
MKASIDSSRCEGRKYCARFAPSVFDVDEWGYGRVTATGDLTDAQLADAQTALTSCPEQAISLTP